MVVDASFDRNFYRLAGYRPLGRRAVRVDILERLADLIRPALSWKVGLGSRPDGAFDGQSFMVTPQMMSILGANGDDIEEILKALGYRSEPKPAAEIRARLDEVDRAVIRMATEAAARAAAEQATTARSAAAEKVSTGPAEATENDVAPGDGVGFEGAPEPEVAGAESADMAGAETPVSAEPVEMPPPDAPDGSLDAAAPTSPADIDPGGSPDLSGVPAQQSRADDEPGPGQVGPITAASWAPELTGPPLDPTPHLHPPEEAITESPIASQVGEEAAAEEPKPILLWRPVRSDRQWGGRAEHRHRGGKRAAGGAAPSHGRGQGGGRAAQTAEPGENVKPGDPRKPARNRFRGHRDNGGAAVAGRRQDQDADGARDAGSERLERRDRMRDKQPKPAFQSRPREERPFQVDPLSPFAKLAALRDQLKK
jgi:ATP-dependent RNA helicase SUPV3L1/SUV3